MSSKLLVDDLKELPPQVRFMFAPLVKRALGFAVGTLLGGGLCAITLLHLGLAATSVTGPIGETAASGEWLWYVQQYFYGYSPSLLGAFIGLFWGFWTGFVMGFFVASIRNFLVGLWIITVRSRARWASDRDFLDHI